MAMEASESSSFQMKSRSALTKISDGVLSSSSVSEERSSDPNDRDGVHALWSEKGSGSVELPAERNEEGLRWKDQDAGERYGVSSGEAADIAWLTVRPGGGTP